jgi:hypothetical protein
VAGGYDRAEFFRSAADDFSLTRGDATHRGDGYLNLTLGFERVDQTRLVTQLRQAAFDGLDDQQDLPPAPTASAGIRALGIVFDEYADQPSL